MPLLLQRLHLKPRSSSRAGCSPASSLRTQLVGPTTPSRVCSSSQSLFCFCRVQDLKPWTHFLDA